MASPLFASQRSNLGTRWLCLLVTSLSGCAMCQSDFDHYYPAYGGRRARADMVVGRVGSILDPAPEAASPLPTATDPTGPPVGLDSPLPQEAPLFNPADSFWDGELPTDPETHELDLP